MPAHASSFCMLDPRRRLLVHGWGRAAVCQNISCPPLRRVTAPNWHGAGVLVPVGACESGWLPLAGAPATLCAGPPMRGAGTRRARHWRTRPDPFAEVWDELAEQLRVVPELQALTLLEWLQERYPGQYPDKLLRTLQRRVKDWRARFGPEHEVMFPQVHGPGLRGLSDFTMLKGVVITIREI